MDSELLGRVMRGKTCLTWLCWLVLSTSGVTSKPPQSPSLLSISTTHLYWTCPEGATFTPECAQTGAALAPSDILKHAWLFTPHIDQHCMGRVGPRHMTYGHPHGNHSLPAGLKFGISNNNFWMVMQNVTIADQGRYCCMVLDFKQDHKHVQSAHAHVILHVTPRRNGSQECSVINTTLPGGAVPVALAIAACILALLSLPVILLLVYRQRQNGRSNRRAQELVRMDSEAQGHENPVFLGESSQVKTRTVSQIMTRQSSGTGRHLLSEPGTPMSPPAHGDVFFPAEDTIPESPDILLL
ncbi:V-type immunoglobulin domain-containing suppressor of T-cell activation [Dunckerocampus dactyliophorus]|uniref:V-type immunoglobulin domain-containing suppressor of T-cell activation n=1 Tax=Dunckerocampus dactyliophorus TaxID=161453 RepID=UPI002404F7C3|nr:V-type immunoglobulin domain-containing suppressor of T-cell activation [Dunckerocampus dactyliophorus]